MTLHQSIILFKLRHTVLIGSLDDDQTLWMVLWESGRSLKDKIRWSSSNVPWKSLQVGVFGTVLLGQLWRPDETIMLNSIKEEFNRGEIQRERNQCKIKENEVWTKMDTASVMKRGRQLMRTYAAEMVMMAARGERTVWSGIRMHGTWWPLTTDLKSGLGCCQNSGGSAMPLLGIVLPLPKKPRDCVAIMRSPLTRDLSPVAVMWFFFLFDDDAIKVVIQSFPHAACSTVVTERHGHT